MYQYEVTARELEESDILIIKIRTFSRGCKEGFELHVTEEWLLKNMCTLAEGEVYPRGQERLPPDSVVGTQRDHHVVAWRLQESLRSIMKDTKWSSSSKRKRRVPSPPGGTLLYVAPFTN
jgi:hypothetical protein